MKTTVIPAQITTIEDKIVGSLNLTQIMLMMVPLFWATMVYALFFPSMHLAWYKLPLVLIVTVICLGLALRIKGKVVLSWLLVLVRFNIRPKYYIFNKNDVFLRDIDLPVFEKKDKAVKKVKAIKEVRVNLPRFDIKELIQLDNLIKDKNVSFRLKAGKKGGFDVAFEQVQK